MRLVQISFKRYLNHSGILCAHFCTWVQLKNLNSNLRSEIWILTWIQISELKLLSMRNLNSIQCFFYLHQSFSLKNVKSNMGSENLIFFQISEIKFESRFMDSEFQLQESELHFEYSLVNSRFKLKKLHSKMRSETWTQISFQISEPKSSSSGLWFPLWVDFNQTKKLSSDLPIQIFSTVSWTQITFSFLVLENKTSSIQTLIVWNFLGSKSDML